MIVPEFSPASPPTRLSAPPLTSPVAEEPVTVVLVAGDKPAHGAAVARLHISERDGGLDGPGIAADEAAGLQVRNVQAPHIAARKRVGNHALTWHHVPP